MQAEALTAAIKDISGHQCNVGNHVLLTLRGSLVQGWVGGD